MAACLIIHLRLRGASLSSTSPLILYSAPDSGDTWEQVSTEVVKDSALIGLKMNVL